MNDEKVWILRVGGVEQTPYSTKEAGFRQRLYTLKPWLHDDLSATLPDGTVLNNEQLKPYWKDQQF
jgi:hypothetical protein